MGHVGFRRAPTGCPWPSAGTSPSAACCLAVPPARRHTGARIHDGGTPARVHQFAIARHALPPDRRVSAQTVRISRPARRNCSTSSRPTATRSTPTAADAHVGEYYSVCPRVPTRRYVEDIWVHESMPLILEPSSGLYFPGSRVMGGHPRSREFDKISALPPPTNLGRGIGGALSGRARRARGSDLAHVHAGSAGIPRVPGLSSPWSLSPCGTSNTSHTSPPPSTPARAAGSVGLQEHPGTHDGPARDPRKRPRSRARGLDLDLFDGRPAQRDLALRRLHAAPCSTSRRTS